MRLAATALTLGCLAALPAAADPVVVELYTSQGCSSCPPADEMLGQLAKRDDVLALSLHVDYWDWIGWRDTFADPAYSERQLQYALAEGANARYTPQFIIGGVDRVAGPSGMQLSEMVGSHVGTLDDVLQAEGSQVTVSDTGIPGQLIAVSYMPEATVQVLHGENAGKSITYHNIVTSWTVLQDWDGAATMLTVPVAEDGQHRAVLAQTMPGGMPGPIIGAVALD